MTRQRAHHVAFWISTALFGALESIWFLIMEAVNDHHVGFTPMLPALGAAMAVYFALSPVPALLAESAPKETGK